MYFDDHPPPHFHATYQGQSAFIRISDGSIKEGSLPPKAAKIVKQWALDHYDELMANWQRCEDMVPLELIPGADFDD